MTAHPLPVRALQRLAIRTGRGPLLQAWALAYRAVGHLASRYLLRGERGAAAYLRSGAGAGGLVPGLSDVDLVLVTDGDPSQPAERLRALGTRLPWLSAAIDQPRMYPSSELRDLAGASTLDLTPPGSVYLAGRAGVDRIRLVERPGLYGTTSDWRRLWGPDRLLPARARDAQGVRLAAWLELVYWWRWVFVACTRRDEPRTTDMCIKFVSETARIWLWLAQGERAGSRADCLRRVLQLLPAEEHALRWALDAHRALPRTPPDPFATALPALLRMSGRIADEVGAAGDAGERTEVRLLGIPEAGPLPLVDWRALVCPLLPAESLEPVDGEPADAGLIARLVARRDAGDYPALFEGDLMILPAAPFVRSRMRGVQCPVTDPVSFALARGETVASFTSLRGWSARDVARRAVAEHAAFGGAADVGRLFTAARAALFAESLDDGEPALTLTLAETARRLGDGSSAASAVAEEALGAYTEGAAASAATIGALRDLVLRPSTAR